MELPLSTTIDPLIAITAQLFLSVLFLGTGVHKLLYWKHFYASLLNYRLLPVWLSGIAAVLLCLSELSIAIGLFFIQTQIGAACAAMFVLGIYLVSMAINIMRGRKHIDCGCSFNARTAPLSMEHLERNILLIFFAGLLLLPKTERTLHWFDIVNTVAAVTCLGLLYIVVDKLLANRGHTRPTAI